MLVCYRPLALLSGERSGSVLPGGGFNKWLSSLLLDIASSASCLLNVLELALVPTTFLNLGLIEVVEDFVEQQRRAEDERQGRAEDDTPYAVDAPVVLLT